MTYQLLLPGIVIACAVAAACSTPPPPQLDPAYERGLAENREQGAPVVDVPHIADVQVTVSPGLPPDRAQRLSEIGGADIIRRSIMAELGRRGRLNTASEYSILVDVTGFRLRSTGTSLWLGVLAGRDSVRLSSKVVRHASEEFDAFETAVSSAKGGMLAPSASGRFNRLARVAAQRLVGRLFSE